MEECDTLIIAGIELSVSGVLSEARAGEDGADRHRSRRASACAIPPTSASSATAGRCCARCCRLSSRKNDRSFLEKAQERMEKWNELMEERGTRTDMPMKPQVVTYQLNKLLDDDAIVSSDSGTIATWAARYIDMRGDMQFSLSGIAGDDGQRTAVQHRRGRRISRAGRSSASSAMAGSRC